MMNHYEVQVSVNGIDVYGTDAYSGTLDLTKTPLKHLAGATVPGGLNFTQGLVWMNDVHYNAHKAIEPGEIGTQADHSFAWDNLGFDGPKTYRDLGYDVPLNTEQGPTSNNGDKTVNTGYDLRSPRTWSLPNVTWDKPPKSAKIVFNIDTLDDNTTITASLNGHPGVTKSIKDYLGGDITPGFGNWSMSIDLPASDAVKGTNTLTMTSSSWSGLIANTSLIMVAATCVPGATDCSTTTPPPSTLACDFNGDGTVGVQDLVILINSYGKKVTSGTNGDCNSDGTVGIQDLVTLIGQYGTSP
jgi:hypothetical protein